MKKTVLVCCFFVLMFSSAANAAISSDLYGTYTGSITIGSDTYNMSVTIGGNEGDLSLDVDDYYLWTPAGTTLWGSSWTDGDGAENLFQAMSSSPGYIFYTNAGPSWATVLSLLFSDDDTFTVKGYQNDIADDGTVTSTSVAGSFTRATPIPGAAWLLGTGLVGLVGFRRRHKTA